MRTTPTQLTHQQLRPWIASLVRTTRRAVGWSQAELARRAQTSQPTISRMESGRVTSLDLGVVERVLAALGLSATLSAAARHLDDRARQADGVHAVLNGSNARRVERCGFRTLTEVQVGAGAPRGWIDFAGFRDTDAAMVVGESKADLHDMGELQRQVAFYAAEAPYVARRLGWRPRTITILVVCLDSKAIAERLRDNRDLVASAFPGSVDRLQAWLRQPGTQPPTGWTLATANPRTRAAEWLRAPVLGRARRHPAYLDYADAARRLLTSSDRPFVIPG